MRIKTIEDYVELVYDLEKNRKPVHTNDVASALDINPASVTEVFQKLSSEGYINYKRYGGVFLTKKGKELAVQTKKKHESLARFLKVLGVKEKIAEKDACEMEHILHPSTVDIVVKFVEIVNQCKVTPFWLDRLKRYAETGKLSKCPSELAEICARYSSKKQEKKDFPSSD